MGQQVLEGLVGCRVARVPLIPLCSVVWSLFSCFPVLLVGCVLAPIRSVLSAGPRCSFRYCPPWNSFAILHLPQSMAGKEGEGFTSHTE